MKTLSVTLTVEDVLKCRPQLNLSQAEEVITAIENEKNRDSLVRWDTIEGFAIWLFGE